MKKTLNCLIISIIYITVYPLIASSYSGLELETENIYFARERYYDPQTGSFLAKDPLGIASGTNSYSYVQDNPLNNVDPEGLDSIQIRGTSTNIPFNGSPADHLFLVLLDDSGNIKAAAAAGPSNPKAPIGSQLVGQYISNYSANGNLFYNFNSTLNTPSQNVLSSPGQDLSSTFSIVGSLANSLNASSTPYGVPFFGANSNSFAVTGAFLINPTFNLSGVLAPSASILLPSSVINDTFQNLNNNSDALPSGLNNPALSPTTPSHPPDTLAPP